MNPCGRNEMTIMKKKFAADEEEGKKKWNFHFSLLTKHDGTEYLVRNNKVRNYFRTMVNLKWYKKSVLDLLVQKKFELSSFKLGNHFVRTF